MVDRRLSCFDVLSTRSWCSVAVYYPLQASPARRVSLRNQECLLVRSSRACLLSHVYADDVMVVFGVGARKRLVLQGFPQPGASAAQIRKYSASTRSHCVLVWQFSPNMPSIVGLQWISSNKTQFAMF